MTPDYDLKMPWGQYKDQSISDIPSAYLYWLIDDCKNATDLMVDSAAAELRFREKHNVHF